MDIDAFMAGYQQAWEQRDERLLCALFAEDGVYHNTPFALRIGKPAQGSRALPDGELPTGSASSCSRTCDWTTRSWRGSRRAVSPTGT